MNIRDRTIIILSTFFYIGYLPFIPGTFGSIFGILIFYFIKKDIYIYLSFTLILTILGLLVAERAEKIFDKKDSRCIVIDEVVGMLLSLIFMPYYDIKVIICAFLVFRILDAVKPYPASQLQSLKGGLGVMTDDIVAGFYTNIVVQIALRLASFKTS